MQAIYILNAEEDSPSSSVQVRGGARVAQQTDPPNRAVNQAM